MSHEDEELDEVEKVIGTELTNKLNNDSHAAIQVFSDLVATALNKAIDDRKALCADELPTTLTPEQREELLARLTAVQIYRSKCFVLGLAAMLSVAKGEPESEFVGHAGYHHEREVEAQHTEVLNRLIQRVTERRTTHVVEKAAKAHSPDN